MRSLVTFGCAAEECVEIPFSKSEIMREEKVQRKSTAFGKK